MNPDFSIALIPLLLWDRAYIINLLFNLILSERLEKIDKIFSLDKTKIRSELSKGLNKEDMIATEDKIILYKLYLKIKKEFEELDKSNL